MNGPWQNYQKQTPQPASGPWASYVPQKVDPTEGMSGTDKFLAGAGKAMVDAWRGARQLAATVGVGDQAAIDAEVNEAKKLDAPLMDTGAGVAGNVVGNIATFLPASLVPGANTLAGSAAIGAGMGLLQPVAEGDSRGFNTALGGVTGVAGYGVGKLAGTMVTPTTNQLTNAQKRALAAGEQLGAKVTPATRTGTTGLRAIEASMESFPVTAGPMRTIKNTNQTVLNRAAAKAIGENAEEITDDVLKAARTRIGQEFDKAANLKAIPLGDTVQNKLAALEFKYKGLLNDKALTEYPVIKEIFDNLGNNITGEQYTVWQSQLGKIAQSKFRGANSQPNVGFALMEVKDALDDAASAVMTRAQKDAFKTARGQWKNLMMLEAGNVTNEQTGNVSGKLLANTLTRKDKQGFRLGGNSSDLYDMARFYKAFPDLVGDSGTATRSALPLMLGTGAVSGLGAGLSTNDPSAGIAGGLGVPLAMALMARGGQAAYLSPLMQRYLSNQALGQTARSAITRAGVLSAPAMALSNE